MNKYISIITLAIVPLTSVARLENEARKASKSIFGIWKPNKYSYFEIAGIDESDIKNYLALSIKLDSGTAQIFKRNLENPEYSINKEETKDALKRIYQSAPQFFQIKRDSIYEITIRAKGVSPYDGKPTLQTETLIFDGYHLYYVEDGVLFRFSKPSKNIQRSTN